MSGRPATGEYGFGRVVVQAAARRLVVDGQPCAVGARAFDVLMALVERRDRVVTKGELLDTVWPGLVVEENNLQVHISALRKALGPSAIATIPGRGYQFTLTPNKSASTTRTAAPEPAAADSGSPGNLPQLLTSFIGRDREIAQVRQMMGRTRLLTLTGSGGCGKTRLAIEAVAGLAPGYPDGVWLVELAGLAEPELTAQAVANVLGLREQPGKSVAQTLGDYLRAKRKLIVVDSAEHLLGACAALAESLLKHCPGVVLLVTSRQGLGIDGELTYRVPSLEVPEAGSDHAAQAVGEIDSVRLLVERARFHQPQFALTAQNAAALASVCRHLDGIPLALELAAARMRSMSVEEVERHLDQRFRLLTGGSRTALPRQQTLRALIDWSYNLLTGPEKALLCRLSTFAGGWTLAMGQEVCNGQDIDSWQVLDLLDSLADKSVVATEERGNTTRYRLLETVREYARERLHESGEEALWRQRHLACLLALAEHTEPHLIDAEQQSSLDRLEPEHDNLRAALAWASESEGDAAAGLRLAGALWRFWAIRGYFTEGRAWLTALLAREPARQDPVARAKALQGAGAMARQQGEFEAAWRLDEESLAIRRQSGDKAGIAASLINLGMTAYERGDASAARALYEEGLALWRELGQPRGIASSLGNLGFMNFEQGRFAEAQALIEESIAISRAMGDWWGLAIGLNNLGRVAVERGDFEACRPLYEESLRIRLRLRDRRGIAESLEGLAWLEFKRRGPLGVARTWGAAERLREQIGVPLMGGEQERHDLRVATVRQALGDDGGLALEWQHGRSLPLDRAVEAALSPPTA